MKNTSARIDPKLIERLRLKRDLLAAGDPKHAEIRPLLLVLGGAMRGVVGGAQVTALIHMGYGDVFDTIIGTSTGAPIGAYFATDDIDQAERGTSIYTEVLPAKFFRYRPRPRFDIDLADRALGKGIRKIDWTKIEKARSNFFTVITDPVTGNIIFADAKVGNTAEMFSKVRASIAVPGFLYGHQVKVNGGMYVDGATINMFPIRAAVERFQPTDVLIITNVLERERNRKKLRIAERLYKNIGLSRNSKEFREAFGMRWNFWSQGWDYFDSLPAKGIHTGTLWAPIEAGFFGERKKLLRKAGEMAMTETFDIFDEHSSQSSAEIMDEWKVK